MNALQKLQRHGQSFWLDNLTREMIHDGGLARRIEQQGLRGVTSNPSIFARAIAEGEEYDSDIRRLGEDGCSVEEIYERLTVDDVRDACDVLLAVYNGSHGADGFVSLEVSPHLARDTQGTIDEACRLYSKVDRPNVLIKIPGTAEGVPAIRECLTRGVNINITLLFSIAAYEAVALAYREALEVRVGRGEEIADVASVASFFLSRIDTMTDDRLKERMADVAPERRSVIESLLGEVAIANAKLAYERFRASIDTGGWVELAERGARPQRMLWASTSTKNPEYSDVRYVEPLIGPETINTMPESTIEAFLDHGEVAETIGDGLAHAREVMERLAEVGIDFEDVTSDLLEEGLEKFIRPYDELLDTLRERKSSLVAG